MQNFGKIFVACVLVAGLTACASSSEQSLSRTQVADRVEALAGEPIAEFRFISLWSWRNLDDLRLVVWTRPREAYLLRLSSPCLGLGHTQGISVTSFARRVQARFDHVTVEGMRCRIQEIRPIADEHLRKDHSAPAPRALTVEARENEI